MYTDAYLEKDHVDKGDKYRGSASFCRQCVSLKASRNVGCPLMDHQNGQVSKHEREEQELRDKLADNVDPLLKVFVVEERDDHAKQHVNNAEDDGDLHLERVEENNLVDGNLPHGVHAKGVGCAVVSGVVLALLGRVNHHSLRV